MEKNGLNKLNGLPGPHPPFNGKVQVTEEIFLNTSLTKTSLEITFVSVALYTVNDAVRAILIFPTRKSLIMTHVSLIVLVVLGDS